MRYTESVRVIGIRPELVPALLAASEVEREEGLEVWVTAVTNGQHMVGSKHYSGDGLDLDDVGDRNDVLAQRLQERLPPIYDVVNEGSHVHVEYHPKGVLS